MFINQGFTILKKQEKLKSKPKLRREIKKIRTETNKLKTKNINMKNKLIEDLVL